MLDRLSPKQRKWLRRILLSAALLALAAVLPVRGVVERGCFLVPYLIAGWDVLYKAVRNIRNGQVFDENFLMSVATVGAFATGQYPEAVFVMIFYQTGELFQDYAVGRSRASIAELMDIRPDTAHVEQEDGVLEDMDPEDVEAGRVFVVRPGERVPLDGVILEGESAVDTAALTGESLPRDVGVGDEVLSGSVNQSGLLRLRASRAGTESTAARILELVENAGEKRAVSEQFITRFARYYTPCVVAAAVLLAVLPPLFVGEWGKWFHQALIFLVISCPCALVISVPLSFFGGIGGASRRGILFKGGSYLEALAKAETVIFDKTGTLTEGAFTVTGVEAAERFDPAQILEAAALAESFSTHPIALSLRAAYARTLPAPLRQDAAQGHLITDVEELAGYGVRAIVDGREVYAGSRRLLERKGLLGLETEEEGAAVYIAINGVYVGRITLSDLLKPDAKTAIQRLKDSGVRRTVLLTGDSETAARAAAEALVVDEYHSGLLPADKVAMTERLLAETHGGTRRGRNVRAPAQGPGGGTVCFVGDGINDAPVLARADVGIAMGGVGSDAAIEAAGVVLMDDKPSKIADAIQISRRTVRIVRQNIGFSLAVKGVVLLLGALGRANMPLAVFADVGVAVLAILNAMRCLKMDGR